MDSALDPELFDALGFDELLPQALAAWRPLLVEGMAFFLERLPPQRLAAIVGEQLAFDAGTGAPARITAVLAHCPTLHKLGQVVARQPALDAALRVHLQDLESLPPATELGPLLARIERELGAGHGLRLGRQALAEGSVAVVLPFSWREHGQAREGVVKVLKPGIVDRLAEELAILPALAAFLERRGAELGLPAIDYRSHLDSAARLLREEIRLDQEQVNMGAAAALLADDPDVFVPELLRWCTPQLTAMARVNGPKLSDASLDAGEAFRLGQALIGALLARPFWSAQDNAVFHGDLHGGNLLLADDGRVAVLDWSLVARLGKGEREALVDIALGALALDGERISRTLGKLGAAHCTSAAITATVDQALDSLVRSGRPPGFNWLVNLLDTLALQGTSGFGEQLAVFRKSWLSLAGVLDGLGAAGSADLPLIRHGLQQFAAEWPARLLAPAQSRAFATHVSTADLLQTLADSWPAGIRYWTRLLAPGR